MAITVIENKHVQDLLTKLLGRDVAVEPTTELRPHSATAKGLVTDANDLVAVIAGDLNFAHRSAAALAMMPANNVADAVLEPESELLEIYQEVANVVSRLVNEKMPDRVRLDPDIIHTPQDLQAVLLEGEIVTSVETTITGYGLGCLGVWELLS